MTRRLVPEGRAPERAPGQEPAGAPPVAEVEALAAPLAAGNAAMARWVLARQPDPKADAGASLVTAANGVRQEEVPALQKAVDAMDAGAVEEAGKRLAVGWAKVEGLRAKVAPPPDEFVKARAAVEAVIGPQNAFGYALRPARTVQPLEGDLTPVLVRQVDAMTSLVREAGEMAGILDRHQKASTTPGPEEQARVVEIWRAHPNPWHTAFLLRVVERGDLVGSMNASLTTDQSKQIQTLIESAGWLEGEGKARPTDAVGALEARLQERAVRVLAPQTPRELAVMLYDDEALGLRLLRTYNATTMKAIAPDALVPAGVTLAVDPRMLGAALGLRFRAAEMMRDKVDRPVLEGEPDGPAVAGTSSRYTVRWPVPETPDPVAGSPAPDGFQLPWQGPLKEHIKRVRIDLAAEHDPVAVADGKVPQWVTFGQADVSPEDAQKGLAVNKPWAVTGRHTVHAFVAVEPKDDVDRYWVEANIPDGAVRLVLPQPVTTAQEAAESEMTRVLGPGDGAGEASFAKTAWMRERMGLPASPDADLPTGGFQGPLIMDPKEIEAAVALGATGEHRLAGDPRALLTRLERYRETLPEDGRDKIDDQIDALKRAINEKGADQLRQLDGVFVSTEGPGVVVPLSLFARARPGGSDSATIEVIDFTLQGKPRTYSATAATPGAALKKAVEDFADDAPYPEGIVRFALGPWHIPGGDPAMAAETVEHETDGGVLLDDYLQMAGFGFLLLAIAAAIIPGAQGLVVPMLVLAGVTAGAGSAVNLYDRLEHGDFEWDIEAGLDILNIAGAILTLGTLSAVTAGVKGVGQVAMITRVARGVGYAQLGLMVGMHSRDLAKAIQTGSLQAVVKALLRAAMDGALVLVVHKTVGAVGRTGEPGVGEPPPGRAVADEPGGTQTSRGTIRPGTAGESGGKPTRAQRTARERHEEWVSTRLRGSGAPREPVASTAPPDKPGVVRGGIADPDQALALFDEVVARNPDREIGLYWSSKDGTYTVKVGSATSIAPPGPHHETVMHTHPNPENVLTVRTPAPADVQLTADRAKAAGRTVEEAIDFAHPDGRRGRTLYSVDPRGTVTMRIDGRPPRRYASPTEYQQAYGERTTYAERPRSEHETEGTYLDMWRDLNEMYGDNTALPPTEAPQTARGSIKPPRPGGGPVGGGRQGGAQPGGPGPRDPTVVGQAPAGDVGLGGVRRGDGTPLTNAEVQELLNRAVGDGTAPRPLEVWRAVPQQDFAREWVAAGGDPNRLPGAFTDAKGVVFVNAADEYSLLVFHEAVHQRAILNGSAQPFQDRYGSFLEEAVTESLAREVLGEHAHRHAYDQHVRLIALMRQNLGVSEPMLRAAYLRGQAGPLEQNIVAGLPDGAARGFFLTALRNIGTHGENTNAMADAIYVMVSKRPPPQAPTL